MRSIDGEVHSSIIVILPSACSKISGDRLCKIVSFVYCVFPPVGYNHAIDSNGAVGHLLTRSAVLFKKLSREDASTQMGLCDIGKDTRSSKE